LVHKPKNNRRFRYLANNDTPYPMANPRQRRKARSSSHKPVSHSKRAKQKLKKAPPIRGPKVLQDAWDGRKTVRQNYAALGLVHTLNPSASGGVEPLEGHNHLDNSELGESPLRPGCSTQTSSIPKGFGKIIRDGAGNILGIEVAEVEEEADEEERGMESLISGDAGNVFGQWVTDLGGGERIKEDARDTSIVRALEDISTRVKENSTTLSAPLSGVGIRHPSSGELGYLEKLVSKYGMDVERMARDRKLNPDQRTTGALKRALRRAGMTGDDHDGM